MSKLKFIHISDTHLLENYDGTVLCGLSPQTLLEQAAEYISERYPDLDCVIISGDLVHDGNSGDYAHFRKVIGNCFGDTPVYLCLGNHDRRAAFYEGVLYGEANDKPYFYSTELAASGVRLIVLDSGYDDSGKGALDYAQLEWLKATLSEPAANGSVLVLHHPPYLNTNDPMLDANGLTNADELYEIIRGSDIFAILSGHTHQVSATMFGDIPHFTADSTAFGVAIDNQYMSINNSVGFTYCVAENKNIAVSHIAFDHELTTSTRISISDLLKMAQVNA
jgi:3',5'-cyclic AMP phosphodiesterase CpdA